MPQSLDSLRTSKRIRGDLSTIWKGSKKIKKINRTAISSFAEADLSLAVRPLSRFKQIRFNLFSYLQGDDYTLALLINSPSGVQGEGLLQNAHGETSSTSEERGLHKQRLLHNAPRVL